MYRIGEPEFREKMAAFDYDWTLVKPNGRINFSKRY